MCFTLPVSMCLFFLSEFCLEVPVAVGGARELLLALKRQDVLPVAEVLLCVVFVKASDSLGEFCPWASPHCAGPRACLSFRSNEAVPTFTKPPSLFYLDITSYAPSLPITLYFAGLLTMEATCNSLVI